MKYYIGVKNLETNSVIISLNPLNSLIQSKNIYSLFDQNDFKIEIDEKQKYIFFISTNRNINTKIFEFELDINSIIEKLYSSYDIIGYSTKIPYTSYIYINYPYKSVIYAIFNKTLPNELIEIIIKYLKIKINYRFTLISINNIYLTQPKINIPSIFH
jgi:hypothetical protein